DHAPPRQEWPSDRQGTSRRRDLERVRVALGASMVRAHAADRGGAEVDRPEERGRAIPAIPRICGETTPGDATPRERSARRGAVRRVACRRAAQCSGGAVTAAFKKPEVAVNESEARRLEALRLAMNAIIPFLDDPAVIEIALNADGSIWAERTGEAMARTAARMSNADAHRMLQLVANTMGTEITAAKPSLAAL